jgi:hypothetical protein
MYRPSSKAAWWRRATAQVSVALVSGCLGGQSGGETNGSSSQPDAPAACACVPLGTHPVHARVTRLEGGCAELVVVAFLGEPLPDEYMPLAVGDAFGGAVTPLCAGSPQVNAGDDVFALFSRGTQDSATCPEYRSCSRDRCGDPSALTTTTIAQECAERRAKDPSVDCPPSTISDEDALAAYDRCDTACLEETRDSCASHMDDTQLGGSVFVSPWNDGEVTFYWAGEQRSESYARLVAPECQSRHFDLWLNYYETHAQSQPRNGEQDVAAPPDAAPPPICPLPPP